MSGVGRRRRERARSAPAADEAETLQPAEDGERGVLDHAHVRHEPLGAAVLGQQSDRAAADGAARMVESEQRRAQFAAAGADQSRRRPAPRRGAASNEMSGSLRVRGFLTASAMSPRGAPAARWRIEFAAHHQPDHLVRGWSRRPRSVSMVSPSRRTVTRSQMRKISSILCETYTIATPRCFSPRDEAEEPLHGVVE